MEPLEVLPGPVQLAVLRILGTLLQSCFGICPTLGRREAGPLMDQTPGVCGGTCRRTQQGYSSHSLPLNKQVFSTHCPAAGQRAWTGVPRCREGSRRLLASPLRKPSRLRLRHQHQDGAEGVPNGGAVWAFPCSLLGRDIGEP